MLIDAHIHLFPDALAGRTLPKLAAVAKAPYYTDGTLSGTLETMEKWGCDLGVVLHIATRPSHQSTVNDFAKQVQEKSNGKLICAGTVHPDAPDAFSELDRIKSLDLCAIKLHCDYQGFFFREEKHFPLYEKIAEIGLPLIIHAGWDPLSPELLHAPSEAIALVAKTFPHLTIIAAHMGGMRTPKQAEKHLAGLRNVYFDTSMSPTFFESPAVFEHLIRAHGIDRVLFGTDCPWDTADAEQALIEQTGLSKEEKDLIYYKNASALYAKFLPKDAVKINCSNK